ncbi:unnamed protein product, partial [Protopolystoma xenopodis]
PFVNDANAFTSTYSIGDESSYAAPANDSISATNETAFHLALKSGSHPSYPRQQYYPSSSDSGNVYIPGGVLESPEINSKDSPARFRGNRDVDEKDWDDSAATHRRTAKRPTGDFCDCLMLCRRLFGCRPPPKTNQLALACENGRTIPFGMVWFVRDSCGFACVVLTWLLILYGEFVIGGIVLMQTQAHTFRLISGVIFHTLTALALISHLKTVFTDPMCLFMSWQGSIPIGNATKEAAYRIFSATGDEHANIVRCPKCYSIKPARAHHCRQDCFV